MSNDWYSPEDSPQNQEDFLFSDKTCLDNDSGWYISDGITNRRETVVEYQRIRDKVDPHEYVELRAQADTKGDDAMIEIFMDEAGVKVNTLTNVHFDAVFNVLDELYPLVGLRDEVFAGNPDNHGRWYPDQELDEDLISFQLYYCGQPSFDLVWSYESDHRGDEHPTPFDFEITCFDFKPKMKNESMAPIANFIPVMLREDIPLESKGQLTTDLSDILNLNSTLGSTLLDHMDTEDIGRLVEKEAEQYDPHR